MSEATSERKHEQSEMSSALSFITKSPFPFLAVAHLDLEHLVSLSQICADAGRGVEALEQLLRNGVADGSIRIFLGLDPHLVGIRPLSATDERSDLDIYADSFFFTYSTSPGSPQELVPLHEEFLSI